MLLRMFELLYSPLLLLLISYKSSFPDYQKKDSTNQCPNATSLLFYDHPNSSLRGCYMEGSKGPCGVDMRLYKITDETSLGECDCDMASARILVYHNETNQCYPIFKQGYCETGEQLVLKKDGLLVTPACERTICYEALKHHNYTGSDLVPFNKTCVEVGSKCLGSDMPLVVGFHQNFTKPICIMKSRGKSMGVGSVRCSPGTYRAMTGHCQPAFSFDDWE